MERAICDVAVAIPRAEARTLRGAHMMLGAMVAAALLHYAYTTARYGYAADVFIVDPILYHLPAVSWYFDGDCDYANNLRDVPGFRLRDEYLGYVSPTGRMMNIHPCGWSLIAFPFVAAADVLTIGHNALFDGDIARTGHTMYYRWLAPLPHVILGLLGLLAAYDVARRYFSETASAVATVAVWAGTNVGYFVSVEPTMSHASSMALVACAIWCADTIRRWGWTWRRAVLLGLCGGMMGAVRYYNVVWAIVPAVLLLPRMIRQSEARMPNMGRAWAGLGLAIATALVCFVPQILVNLSIEGHALGRVGKYAPSLLAPDFAAELMVLRLYPLMAVALLGACVWATLGRGTPLATALLLAFVLHVCVYACAFVPGYSRRYVTCAIVLVPGLAFLIDRAWRSRVWAAALGGVILVCCGRQGALVALVDLGIISRRTINDLTAHVPDVTGGLWSLLTA